MLNRLSLPVGSGLGSGSARVAIAQAAASLLLLLAMFIAAPSAASARPVLRDAEQARIEEVLVTVPADAPPTFADTLKQALLTESGLYGAAGRPLVLKVDVRKVHLASGVGAFFGDSDRLRGVVTVIDPATNQPQGNFKVDVGSEPPSNGGSTILGILSFIDPTGLVGLGQDLAKLGGGRTKPEIYMSANFASYALKQTFGSKKAKAANQVRRQRADVAAAEAKRNGAVRKAAGAPAPVPTPQSAVAGRPETVEAPEASAATSDAVPRDAAALQPAETLTPQLQKL